MNRRDVLGGLGVGISALGGCLPNSGSSTTNTPSSTDTPAFDPEGVIERIRVGETPDDIVPHGVVVWNAVESSRSLTIRVFDISSGETRHEQTYDLPGDTAIAISLRAPSQYQITLGVTAADIQRTISVSERLFDTCNESYTHVSVREDGRISDRTMTTELECTTATE